MDKQRAIAKAVTCLDSRFVEEAAQSEEHKRISWKPLLSAAACLLLVAGLWLFRPRPLKVTVNGENVLNRTVSWSQDGDAQVMRLSLETEIPLTLEPGSKASLTLTADENSALALDGGEEKTLTLTKKASCTWILYPGADGYFLQLSQGGEDWCLQPLHKTLKRKENIMKKLTSLILCGALCAGILVGCGKTDGNTTAPSSTAAATEATTEATTEAVATSYESAQALLESIHKAMPDDAEFPAAGGDEAHDNMEGAGEFDISVYGDSFQAQILVDEELTAMVKPQAATMLHMMNTNTFCSAVMQLNDAADAEAFASHYQQIVQSHHWMCGFPDTVVVLRMTDYVITAYGADDLIQAFKTAAQGLGAEVLVEAPAEA